MVNALLRGLIIYLTVTLSVRLMGKRQISDLQPYDLVITILISEISAIPLQDNSLPMINTVAVVLMLVSIEIIISYISLHSKKLRRLLDGNSVPVIKDGKIDLSEMRKLRMSAEDLLSALRQKDVFDISDVSCAYVETNGALSVLLKSGKSPCTPEDMDIKTAPAFPACAVISDGKADERELAVCQMSRKRLTEILNSMHIHESDVFIMTATKDGKINVIKTEEGR
ncbi:MAG: DUF421 domain-containing protein [Clostridia bacterium]|nr:DUF421 domain-containing protein [Clostridia bacterium]